MKHTYARLGKGKGCCQICRHEGNKMFIVVVNCRNNTFIRLLLDKSYEKRVKDLILGRKINFEGKLLDMGIFYDEGDNENKALILIGSSRLY
jgi:hypothetical protein